MLKRMLFSISSRIDLVWMFRIEIRIRTESMKRSIKREGKRMRWKRS